MRELQVIQDRWCRVAFQWRGLIESRVQAGPETNADGGPAVKV